MRKLRAAGARVTGFFGKAGRERDMAAEFESHFQMAVEDNLRAGMSESEARRAAMLQFGGVDAAKEEVRDMSTTLWIETTLRDIRYALRGLRRSPGFAAAAILSLALGVGASVSIFAVADSLLVRPLPFRDPGRVVMVWERNSRLRDARFNVISPGNFRDWRAQNDVFENMAAFGDGRSVLIVGDRVEEIANRFATADLLPMLGVEPYRGRFFTAQEDVPNGPNVLVISYRLWQSWFGGEESVIGRKVQLRSQPATIIGVLPPNFYFRSRNIDVWEAMGYDPARDYRKTSGRYQLAAARLKRGASFSAAQAEMTAIAKRLEEQYPAFDKNWTVALEPLRDSMVREVKTSLLVLLGAVGLLLAVACANVANLLLARYTSRKREVAVRVAIGAGRGRVMRQLLTESVVLALAGGVLGLGLARLEIVGMVALAPRDMVRNAVVTVDWRIAGFAFALSLLTGILFGLAPSLVATRNVVDGLREAARSAVGGGRGLRSFLVAGEVALSLILLTGAGLLFRSVVGLQGIAPGIDPGGVVTFRVSLPRAAYREPVRRIQFFATALDRIRQAPGVRSASAVSYLPFDDTSATSVTIAGRPPAKPGEELTGTIRTVMPGYFRTMGIPLLQGRDFTAADDALDSRYRFIVNETFARRFLAGEEPLGKQISAEMDDKNPLGEIIGVVGDVKEGSVDSEPSPTVYYVHAHLVYSTMMLVVKAAGDPQAVVDPARQVIRSIDPAQPIAQVRTMESIVRETFSRQRFSAMLLVAFSIVALLLAAVGIYGVLAYSVTERTREIGVRIALGAQPGRITRMIAGGAARIVAGGLAVGVAGSLALTGLLKSLLFGVTPRDWTTLMAACLVLVSVAAVAAYVPSRRASRLAPLDALRME